jgi:hypothetical protein
MIVVIVELRLKSIRLLAVHDQHQLPGATDVARNVHAAGA